MIGLVFEIFWDSFKLILLLKVYLIISLSFVIL